MITAYHFTSSTLRNGDPIPRIGGWLEHQGDIIPCEQGLHASEHPFDAIAYAPGNRLHLVELDGEVIPHGDPVDKLVARRRRIIASIDATELLWAFARACALTVADLWDPPKIVSEYLMTGKEYLRVAARDAARDAAGSAARDAARDAAWDAAWAAAWDAAAARDAARAGQRALFERYVNEAFHDRMV